MLGIVRNMSKTKKQKAIITRKQKIGLVVLGIFLALIILETSLRIGGYVMISKQRAKNMIGVDDEYVILCLGESTTAELHNNQSQWPSVLEMLLNNKSKNIKFKIVNEAIPGTTTANLYSLLNSNLEKYAPDMVITLMGINDYTNMVKKDLSKDNRFESFIKGLRTYKLFNLVYLHLFEKIKETKTQKESSLIEPDTDYAEIGRKLSVEGKSKEAEEMFMKALKTNPNDSGAYLWLGYVYQDEGDMEKAEEMFKKAIEVNPDSELGYIGLGRFYMRFGRLEEAEKVLNEAIEVKSSNDNIYTPLALVYKELDEFENAEKMFKKAIGLNPNNYEALFELGEFYWEKGNLKEAEEVFKKINITDNEGSYLLLGGLYERLNEFENAEEILLKAIDINPENDRVYSVLGGVYKKKGNKEKAEEMFNISDKIRMNYQDLGLVANYQNFYEILNEQEIKFVVMQYPLREIREFKDFFDQEQQKDIIFIENKENFEKALEDANFKNYFIDRFAGDFGHCTIEGNRLIAKNVADVILKELKIS